MVKSRLPIPKIYGHSAAQLTISWVRESPCLLGSMGHSAAQLTICWVRESPCLLGSNAWDTQQHNLRYAELENPRVYWGPWDTQQHNLQYAELELVRTSTFYDLKEKRLSTFDIMHVYFFFVRHIHFSRSFTRRTGLPYIVCNIIILQVKSRPGNFTFAVNSNQSNNNIPSCTSLDLNRTIFFLCLEK